MIARVLTRSDLFVLPSARLPKREAVVSEPAPPVPQRMEPAWCFGGVLYLGCWLSFNTTAKEWTIKKRQTAISVGPPKKHSSLENPPSKSRLEAANYLCNTACVLTCLLCCLGFLLYRWSRFCKGSGVVFKRLQEPTMVARVLVRLVLLSVAFVSVREAVLAVQSLTLRPCGPESQRAWATSPYA